MKSQTKNQLIAVIVITIIAALVTWYITFPRQQYNKLATLVGITFLPPDLPCTPGCGPGATCVNGSCISGNEPPPPILTFTFSSEIDPASVKDTMAVLKSFNVDPNTSADVALKSTGLISALLAKGGVPFTPVHATPTTITSNTPPPSLQHADTPPLYIKGAGEMWFITPMGA